MTNIEKNYMRICNPCIAFFFYPIKENINNPLYYIDKIKDGDLILFDNYFPVEGLWEEKLGDKFLEKYLELGLKCKIICISDYGENLLDKFVNRKLVNTKGDIVYWCSSKDINDITKFNLKLFIENIKVKA